MASVTNAQLRSRAKTLADQVNSSFVTTAEWTDFANAEADELYDLLVESWQDYNLLSSTISTVASTATYALPTDFYKPRGVDYLVGSDWVTLRPFDFAERNRRGNDKAADGSDIQYQIRGDTIALMPPPSGAGSLRLWYTPKRTLLSLDSDALDGVAGWEDFVINGMAARAAVKEETDPAPFLARKSALKSRIERMATKRTAAEPAGVVDVNGLEEAEMLPWRSR